VSLGRYDTRQVRVLLVRFTRGIFWCSVPWLICCWYCCCFWIF